MASPEKAVVGKINTLCGVGSIKRLKLLFFEVLRIDEDDFENLGKRKLIECAPHCKSQNVNRLIETLKQGGNDEC